MKEKYDQEFVGHSNAEKTQEKFSAIDIGCGNGWVVRLLKDHPLCYSAEGIDGAEAMIAKAKEIDSEQKSAKTK